MAKVENYYCEQCEVQLLDHENIMQHVGTHIEFYTGRASKYGRDQELWAKLNGNNSGYAEVLPSGGIHSGHNLDTPTRGSNDSGEGEDIGYFFRGVFDNASVSHVRENSGTKLTVENRANALSVAVSGSSACSSGL